MLILLTGSIQTGKTTACGKALNRPRTDGLRIAGLLTPPLIDDDGTKIGIWAQDVRTGERRVLARLVRPGETPTVGVYRMEEDVLAWARDLLASALSAAPDWIVIDEIGPLELRQDKGFAFFLEPLADPSRTPNAIAIVRESLVDELSERLGRADVMIFRVTLADRDTAPGRLVAAMQRS